MKTVQYNFVRQISNGYLHTAFCCTQPTKKTVRNHDDILNRQGMFHST